MAKTSKVAESKKKIVQDIQKYCKEYPIIAMVNMENLPAPQLQAMKDKLRDSVKLFMTKKRLMRIALDKCESDKKGIKELEKYFKGMPALLFTKDNPFKLNKILQENKSSAPAKAGQEAPNDLVIPKGKTSFAPGPIISELGSIGLKTGVEDGKVAVKEDSVVAKRGEKIKPKVAEILTRMGIEPMEVGLDLIAAYESGIIYSKDILSIDETEFMNKLNSACSGAFNVAMFIDYPTKDTINPLIARAFNEAKAIGLHQNIIEEGIIDELLSKAERSMLNLKDTANIEVHEIEKKEEIALEKEKEIIEEEKELEKPKEEKPSEESTPEEKEVKEAVKEIEETQLEKERVKQEKSFEKLEEKKEKVEEKKAKEEEKKEEPVKKEEPKEDTADDKVKKMVEETKKHDAGHKEPTADDLLNESD